MTRKGFGTRYDGLNKLYDPCSADDKSGAIYLITNYNCEICGKHKRHHVHSKCSKIKQANYKKLNEKQDDNRPTVK